MCVASIQFVSINNTELYIHAYIKNELRYLFFGTCIRYKKNKQLYHTVMLASIRLIKNKVSNWPNYAVFQILRVQNIFFNLNLSNPMIYNLKV